MTTGPAFFSQAGGGSSGALDSYLSNSWAILSLTKLRGAYSGQCLRVRRSSDNTESDIPFGTDGRLDEAALGTFVGANSGYVRRVYDQSGNGNDFGVATNAAQPLLVNAGAYLGTMRFDGTDDYFVSEDTSGGSNNAIEFFARIDLRSQVGTQMMVEHTVDTNTNDGLDWYNNAGSTGYALTRNSSAQISGGVYGANLNDYAVSTLRGDADAVAPSDKTGVFKSGALIYDGVTTAGVAVGPFANANYYVASRAGTSLFAAMDMSTLVIYHTAHSNGTINSISDAIEAVADVYWNKVALHISGQGSDAHNDLGPLGLAVANNNTSITTTYPIGPGESIEFDANSDYLEIANTPALRLPSATETYTVEALIWPTSLQIALVIGQRDLTSGDGWELLMSSDGSFFIQGSAGTPNFIQSAVSQITTGVAQHIAWTWDGTTHRLFLDGVLKASETAMVINAQAAGLARLGRRTTNLYHFANGGMAYVRVTNAARWTAAFTPPTLPLLRS